MAPQAVMMIDGKRKTQHAHSLGRPVLEEHGEQTGQRHANHLRKPRFLVCLVASGMMRDRVLVLWTVAGRCDGNVLCFRKRSAWWR